ncbi:uncharacterized protein TNCV_2783761 [Trichonephila clavipes]|nr:uncharacterized protein TNCV_2783761 [Trichonephila clavipes]
MACIIRAHAFTSLCENNTIGIHLYDAALKSDTNSWGMYKSSNDLCGNALACINGFPISDDNYDRALDLLKDRLGNKNMLINAHLTDLLNLTPVGNPTDIVGLRNLYDRAETQIRSLESLGVKGESYSNLLTPILLKQIPSELVLEFNRSQKDEGFDLSALLQFLHLEIRCRERASQTVINYVIIPLHRKTEQK